MTASELVGKKSHPGRAVLGNTGREGRRRKVGVIELEGRKVGGGRREEGRREGGGEGGGEGGLR